MNIKLDILLLPPPLFIFQNIIRFYSTKEIISYIIGKMFWFRAEKHLWLTCSAVQQCKKEEGQKEMEIKESQSIPISLQWLMKRAPLLFPHTRVPFAAARKDTLLYQLVFAWVNQAWALLFFHRLLLFVLHKFFLSLSLSLTLLHSLSQSASLPLPLSLSPSPSFFVAFKTRAEVKRKLRGTRASVTTTSTLQRRMRNVQINLLINNNRCWTLCVIYRNTWKTSESSKTLSGANWEMLRMGNLFVSVCAGLSCNIPLSAQLWNLNK